LTEEVNALKENETLGNLRVSLKLENELLKIKVAEQEETIRTMQEKMNLDEGVLENLRSTIEQDDRNMANANLKTEVRQLKIDVEKKNDIISKLEKEAEEDRAVWESAAQDILNKSAAIREEYGRALALFGAEPSPFPSDAEEGALGLLDWLLAEFEGLGDILTGVSDYTAVMVSESVMAILSRKGCMDLEKIACPDYSFPDHS